MVVGRFVSCFALAARAALRPSEKSGVECEDLIRSTGARTAATDCVSSFVLACRRKLPLFSCAGASRGERSVNFEFGDEGRRKNNSQSPMYTFFRRERARK
ncbi:hypothetical protein DFH11DRAFT_305357 [Phellopilus nigrolimitatus]|nr:hypothetical protein DFH11DRAFT_305357 [Phellopilus nigrolimitatus]